MTIEVTSRSGVTAHEWAATRYQEHSNLLAGCFACITLTALGLMHGGYFPTAWGWGSILCLWLAVVLLLTSDRILIGVWNVWFLGGLTAFVVLSGMSAWWSISPGASLRELERGLLSFSAVLVAILLCRRRVRTLLGGVLAGIAVVTCYGLADPSLSNSPRHIRRDRELPTR